MSYFFCNTVFLPWVNGAKIHRYLYKCTNFQVLKSKWWYFSIEIQFKTFSRFSFLTLFFPHKITAKNTAKIRIVSSFRRVFGAIFIFPPSILIDRAISPWLFHSSLLVIFFVFCCLFFVGLLYCSWSWGKQFVFAQSQPLPFITLKLAIVRLADKAVRSPFF